MSSRTVKVAWVFMLVRVSFSSSFCFLSPRLATANDFLKLCPYLLEAAIVARAEQNLWPFAWNQTNALHCSSVNEKPTTSGRIVFLSTINLQLATTRKADPSGNEQQQAQAADCGSVIHNKNILAPAKKQVKLQLSLDMPTIERSSHSWIKKEGSKRVDPINTWSRRGRDKSR